MMNGQPRKRVNILIIITLMVAAGIGGMLFATHQSLQKRISGKDSDFSLIQSNSPTGSYLAGRLAMATGDVPGASRYLLEALKTDPQNPDLLVQTIRALIIAGNMDKAIELSERLAKTKEGASFPNILYSLSFINKSDFKTAAQLLNSQSNEELSAILVPLMAAWIEVGAGDVKKPIEMKTTVQKVGAFAPFIFYQLGLINDLAGFDKEAQHYYQRAALESAKLPYRVVQALGNFYERKGETAKATELYAKYAKSVGDETLAITASPNGAKQPPLVASAQEGIAEVFFSIASIFYTEDAHEDALVHLRMALYLRPDFPAALLMLGNSLEQQKDYSDAIKAYATIDPTSPFFHKGRLRTAYIHDLQDDLPGALKELDAIAQAAPDKFDTFMVKGDLLRNHERFAEAITAYDQALALMPKSDNKQWATLYARAICYERTNQWEKAEADFLRSLELNPDEPDVLNYLGYSWLIMNKNVPQARKMIEEAITKRPGDAHIIDSMGWALYTQGDYDGALHYIERAVELTPQDPTVNDHLGDVYWRLGREIEARFQWERVLVFKPEKKMEESIHRKLSEGLPAIPAPTKLGQAENDSAITAQP